jgi:hypothetical protein
MRACFAHSPHLHPPPPPLLTLLHSCRPPVPRDGRTARPRAQRVEITRSCRSHRSRCRGPVQVEGQSEGNCDMCASKN